MEARSSAILYIICLAIVLTPILVIEYPPLVDYPNHLARLFILTHPDDPQLAEFYRINWSLLPNLGFDLIGYALAQVMPVELAGRVFLGISFAVALSAPMVLHRALFGRFSLLPLVAGALLFNRVVQTGFLSFFLGVGLAIWAFAIWLMCRRASALMRFALMQFIAIVIFICHLYAVAVLAILVVMSAAAGGWRASIGRFSERLKAALKAAAPESLPFVLPFFLLFAASETGSAGTEVGYTTLYLKFAHLPMSLMLYLSALGLILLVVVVVVVVVSALLAWLGGGRILHPAVVWPAVTMLLIYLLMPSSLLSGHNADWRLIIPLALVLVGAAEDPFRGGRAWITVGLLVIGLNTAAAFNAWTFWRTSDGLVSEFRTVLGSVPRGALLIPYIREDGERNAFRPPSLRHIATLAVLERAAMVPTVFAIRGQQPIELEPPYKITYDWYTWLKVGGPSPREMERFADPANYVVEIRTDFDIFELVPPLKLPGDEVARTEHFTLYRMRSGTVNRTDSSSMVLQGREAYKAKDYARARALYDQACKGGDAEGCFRLATMFEFGAGGAQDKARARELYDQACKGGDAEGCYYAGRMFDKGKGGARDKARARAFYDQACKGGDARGCYLAGRMFDKGKGGAGDKARARAFYDQACKGGDARGCYLAGRMFDKGKGGARDQARARELYDQACKGGDAEGCYRLGRLFDKGEGGARDKARARALYDQACKGREAKGCSRLQ